MAKTLYHSTLAQMGDVAVTIKSEPQPSKYKGKPAFVSMLVMGEEKNYNVENAACEDALRGRIGQTLTIQACGSRDEATIQIKGNAPAQTQRSAPPQSQQHGGNTTQGSQQSNAPAPSQSGSAAPVFFGPTIGMAINIAVSILSETGEPFDAVRIHEIASDILRVSWKLEHGQRAQSTVASWPKSVSH